MSRSYHSNKSWRYWLQAGGLSSEDIENIGAKGQIKRGVRERRVSRRDPAARSPAYGIEITIPDDRPELLYPTSEGEIRQVLSRIEAPELEGVRSITLGLGMTQQECYVAESNPDEDVDYDPVFNRPGVRLTAGLYFPLVAGTYAPHAAAVELYGYVVTDEFEIDPMGEFALKIQFVRTLLHEMAHHHQYRTAMLQGRVVSQLDERFESKAEEISEAWFRERVGPLLKDWANSLPAEEHE